MKQSTYKKNLDWLKTNPSLDELCAKYPDEWATVQGEISAIVERGAGQTKKQLQGFLAEHRSEAGIVYCLSRKKVDETAAWLCQQGIDPGVQGCQPR